MYYYITWGDLYWGWNGTDREDFSPVDYIQSGCFKCLVNCHVDTVSECVGMFCVCYILLKLQAVSECVLCVLNRTQVARICQSSEIGYYCNFDFKSSCAVLHSHTD